MHTADPPVPSRCATAQQRPDAETLRWTDVVVVVDLALRQGAPRDGTPSRSEVDALWHVRANAPTSKIAIKNKAFCIVLYIYIPENGNGKLYRKSREVFQICLGQ